MALVFPTARAKSRCARAGNAASIRPMTSPRISSLAHRRRPIAAPLDDGSVDHLLDRALAGGARRVLDLGCGQAAWLRRVLAKNPLVRATGVDSDENTVTQARAGIEAAGLTGQITVELLDAKEFTDPDPYDLVLCVGATHAFGGLLPTLHAARQHLAPGGRVLVGEGFWEGPPNQRMLEGGFGADEYDNLAATVDRVVADGWAPVHGHISTLAEWDAYEWAWTGSVEEWALEHPDHPDRATLLEAARRHRQLWLHGYRGILGFATLLLGPTS